MNIRLAKLEDANSIRGLISQLGFDHPVEFIQAKLVKLLKSDNDIIYIYELDGNVAALISLHFSTQLAFKGDIMTIGYFVVEEEYRSRNIGKQLEEYVTGIAMERQCSLIEVFSQKKRTDAHRFYERQGYLTSEKFFVKNLEQS